MVDERQAGLVEITSSNKCETVQISQLNKKFASSANIAPSAPSHYLRSYGFSFSKRSGGPNMVWRGTAWLCVGLPVGDGTRLCKKNRRKLAVGLIE